MEQTRLRIWSVYYDVHTTSGLTKCVALDQAQQECDILEAELRTLRADKELLERRRLNCHELMLSCWNQFAQLPDGYSTMDLSTLEDLEYALFDLGLIDDDGKPQWDGLNAAIDKAKVE